MESRKAFIITGPTSGIGYETALELAKHGTLILVGRNREKLNRLQEKIQQNGHKAVFVVCDISDIVSVRKAAEEIVKLNLPIAGLLNNAGIMRTKKSDVRSAQGWDMTFATNHLGGFALTEALIPYLADGTNVVFIGSAIEDPERKPAKILGMKGGRYISAEASANGKWKEGGARMPGVDAYATSKLSVLAAAMALARENKKLHFNVVEPGINPGTGLGGEDSSAFTRFMGKVIMAFPPFTRYKSTPAQAAKVIAGVLTDKSGKTGIYFDEKGKEMIGSELSRDTKFQDRVLSETRALLAKVN